MYYEFAQRVNRLKRRLKYVGDTINILQNLTAFVPKTEQKQKVTKTIYFKIVGGFLKHLELLISKGPHISPADN